MDYKFGEGWIMLEQEQNMVCQAEWTQALEHQKSPNALGPSALGHWVTSDAFGPESTQPS